MSPHHFQVSILINFIAASTTAFMSETERRLASLEQQKRRAAPFIIPDRCTSITRVGLLAAAAKSASTSSPVVEPKKPTAAPGAAKSGVLGLFARAKAEASGDPAARHDAALVSEAARLREEKMKQAEVS